MLRIAFLLEKQHNTNKFKMSVNVKVELKVPDNSYVEWSDAHRYLQQHGHAPQVAFSLNLTGSLSSRKQAEPKYSNMRNWAKWLISFRSERTDQNREIFLKGLGHSEIKTLSLFTDSQLFPMRETITLQMTV